MSVINSKKKNQIRKRDKRIRNITWGFYQLFGWPKANFEPLTRT